MAIEETELLRDLRPSIISFSTLRDSKEPSLPYDGFNACHYTGDSQEHIADCRRMLSDHHGIDQTRLIMPRQTHSANIAVVDRLPMPTEELENIDALVTALPEIALCINTADCVAVVMADVSAGVIAAAHSGWRGTEAEIAVGTLRAMEALGARAERIRVAMGPSICKDCFEVGEEVARRFRGKFPPGTVIDTLSKPHIDLPRAIASSLTAAGVMPGNIACPTECSHCRPDRYFSARRQGINSGRTLTVIMRR